MKTTMTINYAPVQKCRFLVRDDIKTSDAILQEMVNCKDVAKLEKLAHELVNNAKRKQRADENEDKVSRIINVLSSINVGEAVTVSTVSKYAYDEIGIRGSKCFYCPVGASREALERLCKTGSYIKQRVKDIETKNIVAAYIKK